MQFMFCLDKSTVSVFSTCKALGDSLDHMLVWLG